jgi:hypothetical protein
MTDQITSQPETKKNKIYEIVRMFFLCGVLGILLFTFFRMAGKKLGWFL